MPVMGSPAKAMRPAFGARNPQIVFTTKPLNIQSFVGFMAKVGTIKVKPESWKEMFFPNAQALSGS